MLEQRLLQAPTLDYKLEFKNLELMKQRFGDSSLEKCEVMLRDIKDSMRINREVEQMIQTEAENNPSLTPDQRKFASEVTKKLYVKIVS